MAKEVIMKHLPLSALKTADSESHSGVGLDAENVAYQGTSAESKAAFIASQQNASKSPRRSAKEAAQALAAKKNADPSE